MPQVANIPTNAESPKLAPTSKLAAEYGVDPSAVRRWVESGKLTPDVITPGGHYRFNLERARAEIDGHRRNAALAAEGVAP